MQSFKKTRIYLEKVINKKHENIKRNSSITTSCIMRR